MFSGDGLPFGADYNDTSEFMIGSVAVTAVLLESDGSVDPQSEDWTSDEISDVKAAISEGLSWWEQTFDRFNPDSPHKLDFVVDWQFTDAPVTSGYEPIRRQHTDEQLWIQDFLNKAGADTGNDYDSDVRRFNHTQRLAMATDWAFTVFVVDSSADPNGRFADNQFAYAYHGGPFMVMTYDNGDWGAPHMGQVFAHEVGHIFYALDEYSGSDAYTDHSGYYNTANHNASRRNPAPGERVDSLFAERSRQDAAFDQHVSSPSSLEMIGWRDADGDGVLDVLDVPLTLTGAGSYDRMSSTYQFTGLSHVNTLPNENPRGSGHDITLNTVDAVQYRIDGGQWVDAGAYGTYETPVELRVEGVAPGQTVDVRTIVADTGVASNVMSDRIGIDDPADSAPFAAFDAVSGKHQFIDADGTKVTISLRGAGMGELVTNDQGQLHLSLTGTNNRSSLKIKTDRGGDGRVDLYGLTADAPLRMFGGRTVNLHGDVTITGDVSKVTFAMVSNSNWTIAGHVGTLRLQQWQGGGLNAHSAGTIIVNGDKRNGIEGNFTADLSLTDQTASMILRSLLVAGWLDDAHVNLAGSAGSITVGAMRNTQLLVGVRGDLTAASATPSDFAAEASIKRFTIRGMSKAAGASSFINSIVAADTIRSARLRHVTTDNDGESFGIVSRDIGSYRRQSGTPGNPGNPGNRAFSPVAEYLDLEADFEVKIV